MTLKFDTIRQHHQPSSATGSIIIRSSVLATQAKVATCYLPPLTVEANALHLSGP
jgi:hypothetical protein